MFTAVVLAQLTVAALGPDTVRWREKIPVRVVVEAPGREVPRVVAPPLRGLVIAGSYEEARLEYRNGAPWVSLERRYELLPRRPGSYAIGAFTAKRGTEQAESRPLLVTVVATGDTLPPAVVLRARLDPKAHVNFRAMVLPETVYVGQQASYQVGVFLDDDVRLRLRRNPEFVPPEPRSMMVYELRPRAVEMPPRTEGGVRYETHAFERALFPLSAGRYVIPPAELVYALPLSSSFFSRSESFTLRSDSLAVVALEPPETGRPADYQGAVGRLQVSVAADSSAGRVGDPLVLTLRVTGTGNVKLFPRPDVRLPWGTTVPGEERVTIDSTASLVSGTKEFDWIVTPRQAGRVALAPIRYPYFNPYTEKYEIVVTAPDTLEIAPGSLARMDTVVHPPAPPLAIARADRGPVWPTADRTPLYWLLVALAPLPALAGLLLVGTRTRRAARRDPAAALRLAAGSRAARRGRDVAGLRRALVDALAARTRLGAAAFSRSGELAHALRLAGVTPATAADVERLLRELDAAVFAGAGAPDDAARRALDVYRRVHREARPSVAVRVAPLALLLLLALPVAAARAQSANDSAFTRGVAAYDAGRWAEARELFHSVARAESRDPDAWANVGTAAWAAGDTVEAVAAWQRALRLSPLASGVDEHLALVPGAHDGDVSGVLPIPAGLPPAAALGLWIAGWLLVAWRVTRGPRWTGALGAAALLAGIAALAGGRLLDERQRAERLAVVSASGPLRASPALAADPGVLVGRGEVARILERHGAWSRVLLDAGRDGWIEDARLVAVGGEQE